MLEGLLMILAAHQPNFLPYMGFFYKIYRSDILTLSDTVLFSKSGYHNYNYINENGLKKKLTVPVSNKSGLIKDVLLSDWEYNRVKIIKRLKGCYAKAPYYHEIMPDFERTLSKDYTYLHELNEALIKTACLLLGLNPSLIHESDLRVTGYTPTEQIADLCKKMMCEVYVSGDGAVEYLDTSYLEKNNIHVCFLNYRPVSYGSLENLSVIDYLMYAGSGIPEEWRTWNIAKRRVTHGAV